MTQFKLLAQAAFRKLVRILPQKETANKFLIIGVIALLSGKVLALQEEVRLISDNLDTIAKRGGITLYDRNKMKKVTLGKIYLEIPKEWNNLIENYTTSPRGIKKHFIASAGDGFGLPYSSEYAFVVAVEKRNVIGNLKNFLQTQTIDSDPNGSDKNFTKVNDDMFYIRRENIGTEYFKKIDDTVVVIFVYDNGDRIIDDLEQRIINSVGVIEEDTLFDYR